MTQPISAEKVEAEAVAWRWRNLKGGWGGRWHVTDNPREVAGMLPSHYQVEPLYAQTTSPAASGVTEEWVRDTAMNVMLASEVEEAIRILTYALTHVEGVEN